MRSRQDIVRDSARIQNDGLELELRFSALLLPALQRIDDKLEVVGRTLVLLYQIDIGMIKLDGTYDKRRRQHGPQFELHRNAPGTKQISALLVFNSNILQNQGIKKAGLDTTDTYSGAEFGRERR